MGEMVTEVTGAIDYAPIVGGIGTIAAAVALVYVAWKGAKMLLAAVR